MNTSTLEYWFPKESITGWTFDSKQRVLDSLTKRKYKDPATNCLLSIIMCDRFYTGQWLLGLSKIITYGGLYIWYFCDLFTSKKRAREYNLQIAKDLIVYEEKFLKSNTELNNMIYSDGTIYQKSKLFTTLDEDIEAKRQKILIQNEEKARRLQEQEAEQAKKAKEQKVNYFANHGPSYALNILSKQKNKQIAWNDNLLKAIGLNWNLTDYINLYPQDYFRRCIEDMNNTVIFEYFKYNNEYKIRLSQTLQKEIVSNPYLYKRLIELCPEINVTELEKQAIQTQHKAERAKVTPKLRLQILERDHYRCCICGKSAQDGVQLEVDHRIPIAKGGLSTPENLWTLCWDCNRGKSDNLISEEGL